MILQRCFAPQLTIVPGNAPCGLRVVQARRLCLVPSVGAGGEAPDWPAFALDRAQRDLTWT